MIQSLNAHVDLNNGISEIESQLQDLHQQLALIKEAEAQGANKHSLYILPSHYEAYHKSQTTMNTAKNELLGIIKDAEKHIEIYSNLSDLYERQQFSQWLMELKMNYNESNMHIFDLVKEFLHNAGKDDVIVQCEQSEQEVSQLSHHLNISIRKCLQLYQEYFSFITQCPKSYLENHKIYLYLRWAKYLLEMKTSESCELIYEQLKDYHELLKVVNSPQAVSVAFNLDALYKENLMQVNKLFDELASIRTKEPNNSLEKIYNSAKVGISTFLGCEKGATGALEFVIASELILLNRNFLKLEIAAQRSGDWLIKLTSRDGDWFLYDLLLHSTRAVEMINNLPLLQDCEDQKFYKVLGGIKIANNVYKALYDLNFNFHTIILPESMKKIQTEEISVLQLIYDLNKIIVEIGISIPEMISQLEKVLTCIHMQIDISVSILLQ